MNKKEFTEVFKRYIRRTLKNKLCALVLFVAGVASATVSNDATFLVFSLFISLPLFLASRNYIL